MLRSIRGEERLFQSHQPLVHMQTHPGYDRFQVRRKGGFDAEEKAGSKETIRNQRQTQLVRMMPKRRPIKDLSNQEIENYIYILQKELNNRKRDFNFFMKMSRYQLLKYLTENSYLDPKCLECCGKRELAFTAEYLEQTKEMENACAQGSL